MSQPIKYILLIYILFSQAALYAQSRYKVSGIVVDPDGNPIELAGIQVAGTLNGTMTDAKGAYTLYVTPKDSLRILYSCLGYNKAERIIPQLSGDMRLNVRMTHASHALGEVTVSEFKKQTNTMTTLDVGRTKLLPDASGGSIESLIVTFAGVSSNNELSSQYSVRGGNYDENLIYVNGVEIYRPLLIRSGQQEGLSFINPDMTEEVNFSSGGFEARYGDKMSSVLDITYKKPERLEGSVSGSLMGASAYVGSATKNFTQVTGIRYKTGRSLLGTLDTKGEYYPNFLDAQTYMTYAITPRWELSFMGNITINKYKFIPHDRTTSFGTSEMARDFTVYFDGQERDKFDTYFGALFLKHKINAKSDIGLQISGFSSNEEETYDIQGEYWLKEALVDNSQASEAEVVGVGGYHEHARNRLKSSVANIGVYGSVRPRKHNIQWGASVQFEKIHDRIKEWEMRDSAGYSLPHTGENVEMIYSLQARSELSTVRPSAYLQDTYKFRIKGGMFTLNAGLRASYWNFNKELIVSPRASLGFVPNGLSALTLRFATGLYYQAPFYKELLDTVAVGHGLFEAKLNDKIKSQQSIQFIAGGDYVFKVGDRNFKFSAEAYYKILNRINPYTVNNVKIRYYGENCASGYATGLDMKLFGEFVPGTDSWLSFSLMKTQQNINGVKVPLPSDQRYTVSLYFQDYFPGFKKVLLNLKGVVSDGLPTAAPRKGYENGYFRTPAYKRVDIGISYHLASGVDRVMDWSFLRYFKNIWFGIDCFNLLNINNVNSYIWISDVSNYQYAVPNYLTGRQFNFRLILDF
ncbi:MAG: TonB-dependent receptor [Bacteroidales bacterium]|nr:TonB-dependent receptor [Bacteroidales bacterium]